MRSVRANWAEGFRAPNIGELFNTGSRFDSSLDDPCDDYPASGNPALIAHCQTECRTRGRTCTSMSSRST